ncbi:MAG: hypothetical protein Q7S26_00350 [bacterium]|nr:hypothetical protein [bacterium]
MKKSLPAGRQGFAMLLSVLMLAVIGVAISATLLSLSISSAQTTITIGEAQKAKALASLCAEKALQRVITSTSYIGTGVGGADALVCTYSVAQNDAGSDVLNASSTVGQTTRRVQIKITVPQLMVMTWQEI